MEEEEENSEIGKREDRETLWKGRRRKRTEGRERAGGVRDEGRRKGERNW